ncbi:DUF1330 domain-containing protein [Aestuariivirga sp.]|uniref:DUF1330 domain-containing protein n=1 Tax=Aestuariivirga sp. TaxID=2650926 RepID=UPI0039194A34
MTVYLIAHVRVTDDSWIPAYAERVHEIVHRHGGRYLARSANITAIEGERPDSTVIGILAFPSAAEVRTFIEDPDYAAFASARRAGSVSQFYVVDDTDVAGTVPYLLS